MASAIINYCQLDDAHLLAQCEVDFYRSRGPGGQKKNKTSSAVRLRHQPTGTCVTADEERSQAVNKKRAIQRLRAALVLHVRKSVDLQAYARSELLSSCLTGGSHKVLVVGRRDRRYHPAVGEILDLFEACGGRVRDAAEHVGVTTSNLIKFFRNDPKLWARVNQMRAAAGAKPLR